MLAGYDIDLELVGPVADLLVGGGSEGIAGAEQNLLALLFVAIS